MLGGKAADDVITEGGVLGFLDAEPLLVTNPEGAGEIGEGRDAIWDVLQEIHVGIRVMGIQNLEGDVGILLDPDAVDIAIGEPGGASDVAQPNAT